ncbi:AraC family transcriptional regulator [Paenibacillus sp. FSL R7-0333]|uniref:AraC family transcriptional regulator n=1 Tax=Paenibacillus sp. FSL R7-0333 TaxID=1926587 RepID=UPI00096FE03B|nr:AraC family transcriptional regulator [Paenibacillus sp. FSL R7-0333]
MRKWNSAFAALAASYISVVLVIVLLLCSAFYLYFSNHYKEELQGRNRLILDNTARTLEASVLQRVQQIYLEVSLNQRAALRMLPDASLPANLSKVSSLQESLNMQVSNHSDLIQAVHLYAPRQHLLLSSLYGLKFRADQQAGAAYWMDWVNGMNLNSRNSLWTEARFVPDDIVSSIPGGSGSQLITYVHSYPFQSPGAASELLIAIDLKESALRAILQNMMPARYQSSFIATPSGGIVAGSNPDAAAQADTYAASISNALASPETSGNMSQEIGGSTYVISYQDLPTTGWKLFSAAPANLFYEKWLVVQRVILSLCLLALLVGICLSGILAKLNYSPLKRLLRTIKDLYGPGPEVPGVRGQALNEFGIIDSAFNRLNDKVTTLEGALEASSPHIRQNMILNLLQDSPAQGSVTVDPRFLGLSPDHRHYCCLLLNTRGAYARMSLSGLQAAMSGMTGTLEAIRLHGIRILAEELPDKQTVVIISAREASGTLLEQLSDRITAAAEQHFQLNIQLSQGCWVDAISLLHTSYAEAQTLMKYAYFLPESRILKDRELLKREQSLDEIPQPVLMRFKDKLQNRQLDETLAALEQLIAVMREGSYPADYCHFVLANTVFMYSDYLKSIRYTPSAHGPLDLYNEYIALPDIRHLQEWFAASIGIFIMETQKRNSDRALSTIEAAKAYIGEHLSGDLSLDAVSAKVFISPKYLSKLFKEELGITYTDYITGIRMEEARRLIEKNNMSIEQIAGTVGYGTTPYFIKRFKEIYGCTPGNYLRTVNTLPPQTEISMG